MPCGEANTWLGIAVERLILLAFKGLRHQRLFFSERFIPWAIQNTLRGMTLLEKNQHAGNTFMARHWCPMRASMCSVRVNVASANLQFHALVRTSKNMAVVRRRACNRLLATWTIENVAVVGLPQSIAKRLNTMHASCLAGLFLL